MGRTYVGRRDGSTGSVDIYGPDGVKPLQDRWSDRAPCFGWGEECSRGSMALARALLSETFGVAVPEKRAVDFAAEVVSKFPAAGFAFGEDDVRRWGDPPAVRTLTGDELVEVLGNIAVDEEAEAELLDRIVERCWDSQTLRH